MWIRLSWRGTRSQRSHPTARIRPRNAGAQSAPLRENRLPHYPRVSPQGLSARLIPPRRGGLRTPAMTPLAPLEHFPGRPPALRLPLGGHAMPGLAYGLATRAHRVRPSEKTALHIIPGFSAQGLSARLGPPWRGGLRTPVKERLGLTEACLH
jgi:hypothetical protein